MRYSRRRHRVISDVPIRRKRRRLLSEEDDIEEGDMDMSGADLLTLLSGTGTGAAPAEKKSDGKKIFREGNHIYFRTGVSKTNVSKLCGLIDDANNDYISTCEHECGFILPRPIYLHICSEGGDLLSGFMAYDYIKRSHIPIYTVSEGYTVSAATLMYMGGEKRFMTPTSYILIHQLRAYTSGTHAEIKDDFQNNETFMDKMVDIYMSNLNTKLRSKRELLTREDVEVQLEHDIYWDFETCHKKGLAHELYTNSQDRDKEDKKYAAKNIKDMRKYLQT
jgi:ATP-dependent protease ClpP protease subunit